MNEHVGTRAGQDGEPVADLSFRDRYGPWAIIAGASEGVGALYARAMAERGLHLVLLARRRETLEEVAEDIRTATGVHVRVLAVDLSRQDATTTIVTATEDLDVGMLMYCAGADPNFAHFLSEPLDTALAMVQRNCVTPMRLCHHFAPAMVERGRGALVVITSVAGLYGAPNMVTYSATKAFDLVMAEALWSELHGQGVDVLALVLGTTDTPALRRALAERGALDHPTATTPLAGAATPEEVVAEAIANLSNGPTWIVGDQLREFTRRLGLKTRGEAIGVLARHSGDAAGGQR